MSLHVSIDFGTSSTCTVVSVGGAEPQVVVIDGQPLVPSAVFAAADGTLFVGHEAERQAAVDPARFEPHPKRRIDEGELLLGGTVFAVGEVIRAVLQRAVDEARRFAGGAGVDLLVLTHPADWGTVRTGELRQAANGLGKEIVLVPEPVAAAVFHSAGHGIPEGGALAVLDLGGGTVDASVVRKSGGAFQVLATRGKPDFGGADIDQALLEHVGRLVGGTEPEAWHKLVNGREMPDRRRRRVLRQDVRGAKETLSRYAYTDVPMPPPFADAHITRANLEHLISAPLSAAADLVPLTLRDGQVPRTRLVGVFLVGGSSRIPLVSRLIHERTGVVPTTLDQPETVVARGALRAVRLDPERGGLAPAGTWAGTTVRSLPVPGAAPEPGDRSNPIIGEEPTRPVRENPLTRAKRAKKAWLIGAAIALLIVVGAVAASLLWPSEKPVAAPKPLTLRAYEYAVDYPPDWKPTGDGNPEKLQSLLVPMNGQQNSLVAVEEGRLGFDTDSNRSTAMQILRGEYQKSVDAGGNFSAFTPSTSFAGRDVVYYRETLPDAIVEWYTLYKGQFKVSVGCKYSPAGKEDVVRACEQVVSSLRIG